MKARPYIKALITYLKNQYAKLGIAYVGDSVVFKMFKEGIRYKRLSIENTFMRCLDVIRRELELAGIMKDTDWKYEPVLFI